MTIDEIIERLEKMNKNTDLIFYDQFAQMFTSDFSCISWRGVYRLPAIVLRPISYRHEGIQVKEALKNMKESRYLEVQGWKGGSYELQPDDEVYLVACYGCKGDNVTIDEIYNNGYISTKTDSY